MNDKNKNVVLWVFTALTALVFLGSGVAKLTAQQQMVDNFHHWGLSDQLLMFVGGAELLGGLALLLPPTATLAAGGLAVIMVGATFTHLAHGEGPKALVPLILLGLVIWIGSARRNAVSKWLGAPEAHGDPHGAQPDHTH